MKGFLRFFIYIFATWLFGCYNYVPTIALVYFELPLIALLLGFAAPALEVHCSLGCLWVPRVWSGRPGPGIVFSRFLDRRFGAPRGSIGVCCNTQKQMLFSILCGHLANKS